jgi:hypothetical protein
MNFDLNIQNYKKEELLDMFDLPEDYDQFTLEQKENKLRDNILFDKSVDETVKKKTLLFIQQAKKQLVESVGSNVGYVLKKIAKNVYNSDKELKKSAVLEENGSQMIIQRPITGYTESLPSEFFSGVINPLKKRTLKQNLNIDTRFRDNYFGTTSTNYQLDLPIKFSNVLSMQLSAFEMPETYYTISKSLGNNYFTIQIDSSSVLKKAVITVPDGNYTTTSIIDYLNNYCSAGPLSTYDYYKYIVFTLNIDSNSSGSGQMIVGINNSSPVGVFDFVLDFQTTPEGLSDASSPLPLKLGWLFGFRQGIYIGSSNYVSEGIIDMSGSRYIYLVVDDYNNNVNNGFFSAFHSSILNKNILARISTKNSWFDILSQSNLNLITTARQYFGPVDIQKLKIQLLDEYGRVVDLHNMDYSFCLTLQSVYDL